MLSVIYKLASAAIANRIKPHLNEIIDKTQCGFVPGRYIGDSTRIVYDIIKFTEDATIPGMLVLIDFEKAFDYFMVIHIQNFAISGLYRNLYKMD